MRSQRSFVQPEIDKDARRIEVGDHVRMNKIGITRHPCYSGRSGLVVGIGSPNSMRVKFDEIKTIQSINRGYLELVNRRAGEKLPDKPGPMPMSLDRKAFASS